MVPRRAGLADAHRLAALARWIWLQSYASQGLEDRFLAYLDGQLTAERLEPLLADPQQVFWLHEHDGALQGFAQLRRDVAPPADCRTKACVELERLYVAPPCCGRGLGRELLAVARRTWPEQGLWLSVWAGNERAQDFYHREGGERVGQTDFMLDGQAHLNHVFAWPAP